MLIGSQIPTAYQKSPSLCRIATFCMAHMPTTTIVWSSHTSLFSSVFSRCSFSQSQTSCGIFLLRWQKSNFYTIFCSFLHPIPVYRVIDTIRGSFDSASGFGIRTTMWIQSPAGVRRGWGSVATGVGSQISRAVDFEYETSNWGQHSAPFPHWPKPRFSYPNVTQGQIFILWDEIRSKQKKNLTFSNLNKICLVCVVNDYMPNIFANIPRKDVTTVSRISRSRYRKSIGNLVKFGARPGRWYTDQCKA